MNRRQTGNQKATRFSAVLLGLTVALATPHASGSDLRRIGPADTADRATVRIASNADRRVVYDPEEIYAGVYAPDQLYRVVLGSERWAGSRRPARVREVTCRDARHALERNGFWTGPLDPDGSCGAGEPTDWATGNFLNYQADLQDENSDR